MTPAEVDFAAAHYRVAIMQPWEREACAALKRARPDMVVLAYKCLSSTRSYEPGPYYTSGLSHLEAVTVGEHVFAHRLDGTRIEWHGYPGHWQMSVWSAEYRDLWVRNVTQELERSPWDGVMADNDVYDDYYGLDPPLEDGHDLASLRAGLDELVTTAGAALRASGKLLVPNIAESRREPGRWDRHAAYGGGFEEVWLAHRADAFFDPDTTLAQMACLHGLGLTIVRTASDGTDHHSSFRYGLAALWVFGGGEADATFTATAPDQYSGTPYVPELDWDLGVAVGDVEVQDGARCRSLTGGWAGVHLGDTSAAVTLAVPPGLMGADGRAAPPEVRLAPHEGVLYRRP